MVCSPARSSGSSSTTRIVLAVVITLSLLRSKRARRACQRAGLEVERSGCWASVLIQGGRNRAGGDVQVGSGGTGVRPGHVARGGRTLPLHYIRQRPIQYGSEKRIASSS